MRQQHASTLHLIRRNIDALEQFERVQFEMRPFATAGGRQTREIAMLNEQQAALLISLTAGCVKQTIRVGNAGSHGVEGGDVGDFECQRFLAGEAHGEQTESVASHSI